jgi:hypothetical protein
MRQDKPNDTKKKAITGTTHLNLVVKPKHIKWYKERIIKSMVLSCSSNVDEGNNESDL